MIRVIFNGVLIKTYWLIKEPNKSNKQILLYEIKNKSLMIFTKILINKYCLIEVLNEATKQIPFTARTTQIFYPKIPSKCKTFNYSIA